MSAFSLLKHYYFLQNNLKYTERFATKIIYSFGDMLSLVHFRRPQTPPVSCYAIIIGNAASKPTSQLSLFRNFLKPHLTNTSRPQLIIWAISLSTQNLSTPCLFIKNLKVIHRFNNLARNFTFRHNQPTLPIFKAILTLHLNGFRKKPAITNFDQPLTPIHRSSQHFSTCTSSAFHFVFTQLQLVHKQLSWFRVYFL